MKEYMFIVLYVWFFLVTGSYATPDYSSLYYDHSVIDSLNRLSKPGQELATDLPPLSWSPYHKEESKNSKSVFIQRSTQPPPKEIDTKSKSPSQEKTNRTHAESGAEKDNKSSDIPIIFGITPTYRRSTQKVDLTSLCHTLTLVPRLVWIVVEDSHEKTGLVSRLLQRCKVQSVHMNVKTPPNAKSRGVLQRNAGLNWVRSHCSEVVCDGVVYFMDDDNKYDLRLFEEVSICVYRGSIFDRVHSAPTPPLPPPPNFCWSQIRIEGHKYRGVESLGRNWSAVTCSIVVSKNNIKHTCNYRHLKSSTAPLLDICHVHACSWIGSQMVMVLLYLSHKPTIPSSQG